MVIVILKSLGCSKEAINEGMIVNAKSRLERGRTPKFSGVRRRCECRDEEYDVEMVLK